MFTTMLKRIDLDQKDLELILEKFFHDQNPEAVKIETKVYTSEDHQGNEKAYAKVLVYPESSKCNPMKDVTENA